MKRSLLERRRELSELNSVQLFFLRFYPQEFPAIVQSPSKFLLNRIENSMKWISKIH